jgi:hypothetical protein
MGYITKLNISTSCDFGSQMSQYASLIAIGKKTGLQPAIIKELMNQRWPVDLDKPFKNHPLILPLESINTSDMYNIEIEIEKGDIMDKRLFYLNPIFNYNINGDLGLFKYFEEIKDEIVNFYIFKDEIKNFCLNYISNIKQENEVLVSIHFRRGDYLQVSSLNLSLNYYYEALKTIEALLPNQKIKYLIFSNGMEWVKENFKLDNCAYIENLTRYQDMCLMSLCDHNIIANSSFSWWGTYLNQNPNKKVICPYNYLNHPGLNEIFNGNYFPSEWIPLNVY